MKRNLIIVNTYFQLITAINLAKYNFNKMINDIILTDKSVDMKTKIYNIEKTNLFSSVIYIKSKNICNNKNKVAKYIKYLFNRKDIIGEKISKDYDNIIFFNYDILLYTIVDEIYSFNKNVKLSEYDEGYITYLYDRDINRINKFLRGILKKVNISKIVEKKYLYHPELICYKTNKDIIKINKLNKEKGLIDIFNSIFDYNKKSIIRQKYIFFEESFFCDNKGIDDLDLILKISEIVGKDNFIVKLHPRNKINRFEKYNISTIENIGIPWEIIQMNNDFKDKVLLTISSGSVLASRLYFYDNIRTYLLYNCTKKMSDMVTDRYINYLEKVENNLGIDNFIIPNNKIEFLEMLRNENEDSKQNSYENK